MKRLPDGRYVIESEEQQGAEPVQPPQPGAPGGTYVIKRDESNPVIPREYENALSELLKKYNIECSDRNEDEFVYKLILSRVQMDGYKVVFRPRKEMLKHRKSLGYEHDNVIELADDLDFAEAKKILGHEYKAKLRRRENPGFNHKHEHKFGRFEYNDQTGDGGADLVKEYTMRARAMHN